METFKNDQQEELFVEISFHPTLYKNELHEIFIYNIILFVCVDINDCKSDSCSENGKCFDLVNGFKCKCNTGFGGRICKNSMLIFFVCLINSKFKFELKTVEIHYELFIKEIPMKHLVNYRL